MGSIPGSTQGVKGSGVAMSCDIACRHGFDLALLWLWCRPASVDPTWPLAWELPYTREAALKSKKKKERKSEKQEISMDPAEMQKP